MGVWCRSSYRLCIVMSQEDNAWSIVAEVNKVVNVYVSFSTLFAFSALSAPQIHSVLARLVLISHFVSKDMSIIACITRLRVLDSPLVFSPFIALAPDD
jgi:hypothetical protein